VKSIYIRLIAGTIILGMIGTGIGLYFYFNPYFNVEYPIKKNFFWFSTWNNASYARLIDSADEIDMISPSWWRVLPNGTMTDEYWNLDVSPNEVFDFCRSKGIEVHPLVSNYDEFFSSELISIIINNETSVSNFIESAIFLLNLYNCTGINLDFEGVPARDRAVFNEFLRDVKDSLGSEYIISIDVPAKSADWTIGWGGAFDYTTIGEICDYVMIMTYDYSYSNPGQISPISWIRNVLNYATKTIPYEKIYCGIPLYGYNWPDNGEAALSGGYYYFKNLVDSYGVKTDRYSDSKELFFIYKDESDVTWFAVFQDYISTQKKEDAINKYPVGGYCYWYLGIGDPRYWR